jgi:hypothetical protein
MSEENVEIVCAVICTQVRREDWSAKTQATQRGKRDLPQPHQQAPPKH